MSSMRQMCCEEHNPKQVMTMDEYPLSIFFCLFYPPLNMKGRVSNMSEAIITRRGSNSSSGGKGNLITQTFTTNTSFNVPITGNYSVRIFGGGGSGGPDLLRQRRQVLRPGKKPLTDGKIVMEHNLLTK